MQNGSEKLCSDCDQKLPFDSFYRCKFGRYGLQRPCKKCLAIRSRGIAARRKNLTQRAYPNRATDRHLYIALREGFPGFKIGQTKDVKRRMNALKHKYGCSMKLFALFEHLGFLESDMHHALRKFRITGPGKDRELYNATPELALQRVAELYASS